MKFLGITLATVLAVLPLVVHGAHFAFQAFNGIGCDSTVEEEWSANESGDHVGPFSGARTSFKIVDTDFTCDLIVWTDRNEADGETVFFNDFPGVGECAWTGTAYESFDIFCN